MDSIGSLKAFVHAADTRSFTAAGGRLGLSSSAVGKAIGRLEAELGVRLFHRSTRSVTLTPEGSSLLERCKRILGEIEAAELELAQLHEAPRGKLRVSLPMAGMLMMPALNAFMRAHPEVQLDLEFTDRLVDVIDEGFDAVIRAGRVTDSRLVSRKLGEFRLLLVGSPDYFARRGVPRAPEDLIGHSCLHHRFANSGKFEQWPLRRRRKDVDVTPTAAAIVNTIEPLISMVEHGLGVACLPDFAVRRQLADGTLTTVLDAYVEHSGLFHMLWPSGGYTPPKLRVFVDFMAESLFPSAAPGRTRKPRRS
jgi:DNA-binding transcriptional LysR family regulator